MTDKNALTMATTHLKKCNPSNWDGLGKKPNSFDQRVCTYYVDSENELDISFEYEDGEGWIHVCELRETKSQYLLGILSGYGINSIYNLKDTIIDICNN